jgi:hypothetical protein
LLSSLLLLSSKTVIPLGTIAIISDTCKTDVRMRKVESQEDKAMAFGTGLLPSTKMSIPANGSSDTLAFKTAKDNSPPLRSTQYQLNPTAVEGRSSDSQPHP